MTKPVPVLLVLAKAPVPGQAKTRLCPPATHADAAAIAAASLLDTLDAVAAVPHARVMVAWTGELSAAESAEELRGALGKTQVFEQCEGDLGARIAAAHVEVARRAPGAPVLQIGMDTPQLTAQALAEALAVLMRPDGPDAVLGPACDGGWWAMGLRLPGKAAAVASVPMSRTDTGELTLAALRAAGLTVELLHPLRDVDTASDAQLVAVAAPDGRFAAEVRARLGVPVGGRC